MSESKYVEATKGFQKRLGHLIEELGEALQAAGKTVRWGRDSTDPTCGACDGEEPDRVHYQDLREGGHLFERKTETNEEWLLRELGDVEQAIARFREVAR
jgi:hypothetical protein